MAMSVTYTNWGGGIAYENRGGVERDYGRDGLGSTTALYDASQNKTDEYRYWPYGEEASSTGTTPTPFRFVGTLGYYRDSASRMYVRARHYLSSKLRWLTVDPLWPDESAYAYVDGAPTMGVDTSGKGGGVGPCAVYICSEHTMEIAPKIPSHKYACVTGPNGGCSGGIYPKGGPISEGKIDNRSDTCPKGSSSTTTCEKVASGCDVTANTCACIKRAESNAGWYVFGVRDCYRFPDEMIDCACSSVKEPKQKAWCNERLLRRLGDHLKIVA